MVLGVLIVKHIRVCSKLENTTNNGKLNNCQGGFDWNGVKREF